MLHSSGSTLLAAARVLPPVFARLQPHRPVVSRSRHLLVLPPPQQQRSLQFTPITPPLKSTPLQPLGPSGWISRWKWRLQHSREAERPTDLPSDPKPQERGGVGEAVAIVILCLRFAGIYTQSYLNQTNEKCRYSGGAEHWDPEAYQRGGGLSHSQPLPPPKPAASARRTCGRC